jgi:hypothetical protein
MLTLPYSVSTVLLVACATNEQDAPKVLVSVDDAEAGTAQLHRNNSAKKG